MARTIWGDAERYEKQYWSRFPGNYLAGDGAKRDEEGYYWLLGRVDDVLNVAGHRIGTMEVESALVSHPAVAEAAVIGITHEIKGQGIAGSATPRSGYVGGNDMVEQLRNHVGEKIGAIAKPDKVFTASFQDQERQDHAPPAARHRRRQSPAIQPRLRTRHPASIKEQYEGTE
jgi:acetyl-CoA synthetase